MIHTNKSNRLINKFITCISGILLTLLLFTSVVEAQCPTNIVPDSVAWTAYTDGFGHDFLQYPISSTCTIDVYFCYRTVQVADSTFDSTSMTMVYFQRTVNEDYIDTLITEDTACDAYSPQQVMDAASNLVLPTSTTSNPCNVEAPKQRLFRNNCWKLYAEPYGMKFLPCGNASSFCVTECYLCWNGTTVVKYNCVAYSQGPTPTCPDLPSIPLPNTCYHYGCDNP